MSNREPVQVEQTSIDNILNRAPEAEETATAPQQLNPDQSDATGPGDTDDASKDGSWSQKAYYQEKKKRQAYQARMRELEEENAALLADRSYEQQPQVDPAEQQYWMDPYAATQERQLQVNTRASRAEFVAEHGKAAFQDLESTIETAMKSGHADLALVSDAMRKSDDPIGVAAKWANEVLGWTPQGQQQQQQMRPQVMPSNFATARNLTGIRSSGPAHSASTLDDIFNRKRPNA